MYKKGIFKQALAAALSLALAAVNMPTLALAEKEAATIQIVHTNDLHGYYTKSEGGTIGFAALKGLVDEQGADLVLDIGDAFHGQSFATVEQGMSMAELMNTVGYDAMTPGNHDWSYGASRLKELENTGGFKILASNVITEDGKEFFENPYLIKDVTADDGTKLKVGVVGVIDDAFYTSTASQNVEGLRFEEEAAEATKTAGFLREQENCDVVLAITHQNDCEGFVANTKGIDAVLAGHEHIIIDESYPNSDGKQVPVAEAGYYFNDVGVLELTVDSTSKAVVGAEDTIYTLEQMAATQEDEAVKKQISEIEQRQQAILGEAVGRTDKAYPYSWEEIRVSEQEIGKLVTAAYLAETGADVAIENAGGIRAGLDVGNITYKDLISISPYGNVLITKELTGKQLIDILNQSLEISVACDDAYTLQKKAIEMGEDPYQYSWPDNSGSVLQLGGIEIEVDEENRITSAKVGGAPIDEGRIYTVAANNYLAESSNYAALEAAPLKKEYGTCEEALRAYIANEFPTKENGGHEPATRGEAVQMLLAAADDYNPGVQKNDIIKGYEDGELHEDLFVTRVESLVMLRRAFGGLPKPVGQNARAAIPAEQFSDIPEWAKAELGDVFAAGIVAGTAEGVFSPDEKVTAEQMKLFISRVFTLFGSSEKDDFYAAVNRAALDTAELKPGRRLGGTAYDLRDDVMVQVDGIINDILSETHAKGSPEQKMSDYYQTVMDIDGRNSAGYAPIKPYLEMIDKAQNINDLMAAQSVIAEAINCYSFMFFWLTNDFEDSTKYILSFCTAQPEMDKAFYAAGDAKKKQMYLDYVAKRLSLIGAEGGATPEEVYEFDKKLAEKQLSPEEYYDVDKVNNLYSFEQIENMFPGVDMEAVLKSSGLKKEDKICINDVSLTEEYARLFTDENLSVLKARAKLELLNDIGATLSMDFVEASDQFNQDYMGVQGAYTNQEKAVIALQNNMGTYVGKAYAEKYFSPQQKADVTKMAEDIIAVYKKRIVKLDWMSEETRTKALKKLDTMKIKVGYPDDWSTPADNAEIKSVKDGGSYFSNKIAINKAIKDDTIALQGKPVDKTEWGTDAYVVNAFYNPTSNDITFPAAFLQAPIYDPQKSYEYNLGSTGFTIAHEITHAFDNNGAKYDENGNAADWWTQEDYAAFQRLCAEMVELYDGYECAPGIAIDGTLTLSENVADQGALSCVLEIASSLENPNYKDLFYSLAGSEAMIFSREFAQYLSQNDVHSIGRARVNPLVANHEAFYQTFDVNENDGMYIAPEMRVKIW